jgi:diadenosine tetraphosphate (Ap4A) HIT family hydrolase
VTLGASVLVRKADAAAFSQPDEAAFAELPRAVRDIKTTLAGLFPYDKLHCLMPMMIGPQVHYHVIPRYSVARRFDRTTFDDPDRPEPPDLERGTRTGSAVRERPWPTDCAKPGRPANREFGPEAGRRCPATFCAASLRHSQLG